MDDPTAAFEAAVSCVIPVGALRGGGVDDGPVNHRRTKGASASSGPRGEMAESVCHNGFPPPRHVYYSAASSAGPGWVEQRRSGRGRPPEFPGEPAAERDPAPPLGEADLAFRAPGGDCAPRAPAERRKFPRRDVELVRDPRDPVAPRPPPCPLQRSDRPRELPRDPGNPPNTGV